MEGNISEYLRRWLGLPRCLSSALFTENPMCYNSHSEYIVTRTGTQLQYEYSTDPEVRWALRSDQVENGVLQNELKVVEE